MPRRACRRSAVSQGRGLRHHEPLSRFQQCGVNNDAGLRWSNVLSLYVVGLSSYRGAVVTHWYVGCRSFPGVGNYCRIQVQRLIVLERGSGRVARECGPASL